MWHGRHVFLTRILFYSILLYFVLFCSVLFYSIANYSILLFIFYSILLLSNNSLNKVHDEVNFPFANFNVVTWSLGMDEWSFHTLQCNYLPMLWSKLTRFSKKGSLVLGLIFGLVFVRIKAINTTIMPSSCVYSMATFASPYFGITVI